MIWESLSSWGVCKIIIFESLYLNILKDSVIPEGKPLIDDNFLFQQDNAYRLYIPPKKRIFSGPKSGPLPYRKRLGNVENSYLLFISVEGLYRVRQIAFFLENALKKTTEYYP